MTTAGPITVGLTWTLLVDLQGIYTDSLTISREALQTLELIYKPAGVTPGEAEAPEWRVTSSFIGIETRKIPTGGAIWARMETAPSDVEVNYA